MEIINFPISGSFDSKSMELAEKFQKATAGDQFKLCLYDTGNVAIDSVLAFHEIIRTRPKDVSVHIHSHVCLEYSEVLIWLAGDTRTLRADAWIHFLEYDRYWAERTEFQQFLDSLERRELQGRRTALHENYLQVERLVRKQLPRHLLNRRVWAGELAEWNIIKPADAVSNTVTTDPVPAKKSVAPMSVKATSISTQLVLF